MSGESIMVPCKLNYLNGMIIKSIGIFLQFTKGISFQFTAKMRVCNLLKQFFKTILLGNRQRNAVLNNIVLCKFKQLLIDQVFIYNVTYRIHFFTATAFIFT